MSEEKEVATVDEKYLGLGFEDMKGQDFSAPFLVICQANSPYLNPQHQLYNPEAKQSMIINTQNGACYQFVTVIPCKYAFRNVEWRSRQSGGGFVRSYTREQELSDLSPDPSTGRMKRQNGNEILPTAYYLCLLVEENLDKVIIPMYSTQLKKSRRWNSVMASMKQNGKIQPLFAYSYKLSSVAESNNKGTWYGWKIDVTNSVIPEIQEEAFEAYKIDNFLPEKLLEAQAITQREEEVPF